jgi:hypothetical protein
VQPNKNRIGEKMKCYPTGTWLTNGTDVRRVYGDYLFWGDEWKEMLKAPDLTVKPTTYYSNGKAFSTKEDAREYARLYDAYFKAYDTAYRALQVMDQFATKNAVREV